MEVDVEAINEETVKAQNEIKNTAKKVIFVSFLIYALTVIPTMMLGVLDITVSIAVLFGMLYFFPLVTFFLGMAIIWKKKFSTEKEIKSEIKTEIN